MPKFRKKPIVIEAIRFDGTNKDEAIRFLGIAGRIIGRTHELSISTPEGSMQVRPGDWIIRGVKGEYYPCKPDIFEATYESVE